MEKRTLLVIEDNELNREILTAILEEHYHVLTAENGVVGMEQLKKHGSDISLILLDIQMPVMNGYEFLDNVMKEYHYADIPIIVTTASDSDAEQIRCLSLGASDFVVKPYKPEIVIKRVAGLIRLRETALMLHKVEHDEVTGLYNRESFTFRVSKRIQADQDTDYDMICLEIESYLDLLARYGSAKCSSALQNLASHLTNAMPEHAIIGRIDSAQFAVFAAHMPLAEHTRLTEAIANDDFSSGIPSIKINFGIYQNVDKRMNVASILSDTLRPINSIRHQYGRTVALYDDEIRKKQNRDQILADSAVRGIEEKQFQVWYQPKHNAAADTTGGAEALIRWTHPELGFISPGAFIPIFESNGFITTVDLYVVETVCAHMRKMLDNGDKVVPVSANISQIDFDMPDLADILENIVDRYEIPHDLIHFEITESANAGDKKKKAAAVALLHEKGFSVELDDFGSGYSNLSTLGELPIDVIKLDMSLVRNMLDPNHSAILQGVLFTAASMGKKVVAEGVETLEQAQSLKELCGDRIDLHYQGYYFSKPLPADQFEAYLKTH